MSCGRMGTTGLQLSTDVSQKMSFAPQFEITNSITAELTRIERARGFLDAAKLSEDWIAGMQKRALVLEAHYTTHIEGTQLTLEQSERILAGQKVRGARPDDAQELLNYKKAFELVSGYLESGEPITEALIRQIHKRLVQGVRGNKASPGEYRKIQNYIVNLRTGENTYTPPPPLEVPQMMTDLSPGSKRTHKYIQSLWLALLSFNSFTFIPLLTATDARRVCFLLFGSTEQVTISSGFSPSASITTAIGPLITKRCRACASVE